MARKLILEIKDLMKIIGTSRYQTAAKEHRAIRDALGLGKYLTVRQYCAYAKLPFEEVLAFLLGESSHPETDLDQV